MLYAVPGSELPGLAVRSPDGDNDRCVKVSPVLVGISKDIAREYTTPGFRGAHSAPRYAKSPASFKALRRHSPTYSFNKADSLPARSYALRTM